MEQSRRASHVVRFALVVAPGILLPTPGLLAQDDVLGIQVQARALVQPLPSRFAPLPPPGQRAVPGVEADVVEVEYVRFETDDDRFLSAVRGGGFGFRLVSSPTTETTFAIEWLDRTSDVGRLRTSDGWHMVAIRDDGAVDARSLDVADVETVLRFDPDGDGAVFIQRADASVARRFAGAVKTRRDHLLVGRIGNVSRIPTTAIPTRVTRPPLRAPSALPRSSTPVRGRDGRLTLHHAPTLDARPYARSGVRQAVFRKRRAEAPEPGPGVGDTEGPDARPVFDLATVLHTPGFLAGGSAGPGPTIDDLLGIRSQIWGDKNPVSGIYYFLPSSYHLRWNAVAGTHDLDVQYLSSQDGEDPQVLIQATLVPTVSRARRRAAEMLVMARARIDGLPFIELRPLPIDGDATTNTVAEVLRNEYGVDSVGVRQPLDVLGEVRVGWRMSQTRVDNLVEILRAGQGIAPEMRVRAAGADDFVEAIHLNLGWQEPGAYPLIPWGNETTWTNDFPHPVRLNGLHALVLDPEERPTLVSWDLSSTPPVASGSVAAMGSVVPAAVAAAAALTWVDFDVAPDAASTEVAVRSITGGVSENLRQRLVVSLLDPLTATGAARVKVFIRSPYLEPGSDRPVMRTLTFDVDGATEELVLYLGRADDAVPFEWTASLVMPDGTEYAGTHFLPGDASLQLLVSSTALREALGRLPGEPGGS